jgi:hypothetical protein
MRTRQHAQLDNAEALEEQAGELIERAMVAYHRDGEDVAAARMQAALSLIESVQYAGRRIDA